MPTGVYPRKSMPPEEAYRRRLASNLRRATERKYGITLEEAQEIRRRPCAFKGLGGCGGHMCVDHDHQTGRVRGGLCFRHNIMLSLVEHHPDALSVISDYLDRGR